MRTKRITALLACALLAAGLAVSLVFTVVEIHHDCTGADCPICWQLHQAAALLRRLGHGLAALARAALRLLALAAAAVAVYAATQSPRTPVACRVRLND